MRSITSILFSNFVFTVLQPGIVVILIPYLILRHDHHDIILDLSFTNCLAYLLITIGLFILLHCILHFAYRGRGTLSPLDPAIKLVTSGLYQYSRNPMYLGVMLILFGEWLIFQSECLLYYMSFVFIVFNAFIYLYEQPYLKNKFGDEYIQYCKQVRPWI